jgi:hypothetical protein
LVWRRGSGGRRGSCTASGYSVNTVFASRALKYWNRTHTANPTIIVVTVNPIANPKIARMLTSLVS